MDNEAKTVVPTGMLIDTKDIEAAGEALGVMCAAFMGGFTKGFNAMQDLYKEQRAENTTADQEEKPDREDETPKDCCNCWCNECAELEECVVEKKGYACESRPMPCDGCNKGMRYMPKEKPPCEKFKQVGELKNE